LNGERAHAIKQRWLAVALGNAGIDPERWHPSAGVASNRETIERVYGYYAKLYLSSKSLQWAGMATLIGPAFYAGFRDLGLVPDGVRRVIGLLFGRASRRIARWAAGSLGRYETTFLVMQKKIFEDQAVMHEAYRGGGLEAVRELRDAAIIDDVTMEAWTRIDKGKNAADSGALDSGNRELLFREQHDIIDRFYLRMFTDPPFGRAFTYLLTLAGAPSLPDAKSFAEVFPLLVWVAEARAIATPFAAGNIALFKDRWSLIEADTLPDYLRLIRDRDAEVTALIETPIAQRVEKYRLLARIGTLARNVLTHWSMVRRERPRPTPRAAPTPELPAAVTVDLRSPPASAASELPAGADSRTWESATRAPFEVVVRLPGEREYRTEASRAVLLSWSQGQLPHRLIVTLPVLDMEKAATVVNQHALDWNIPLDAVADWQSRTEQRARAEGDYQYRTYSTHVFTAADVGPVAVQLQVAQHLREGAFLLTMMFRWNV
jgi:hypothetical protein